MPANRDRIADLLVTLSSLARTIRLQSVRAREVGTSSTGLGLLTARARGDARPGDLAGTLQVGPSVISRAVVPLEAAGLIERKPDPDDARACLLAITEAGRSRLQSFQDLLVDRLTTSLDDWSDDEVRLAGQLLDRLDHALIHHSPLDHLTALDIEKVA